MNGECGRTRGEEEDSTWGNRGWAPGHNITVEPAEWDITAVITSNNYTEPFITPPSASLYHSGKALSLSLSSCLVRDVGKVQGPERLSDAGALLLLFRTNRAHRGIREEARRGGWMRPRGRPRKGLRDRVQIGAKEACRNWRENESRFRVRERKRKWARYARRSRRNLIGFWSVPNCLVDFPSFFTAARIVSANRPDSLRLFSSESSSLPHAFNFASPPCNFIAV